MTSPETASSVFTPTDTRDRQRGLTVIEVLVAIAILAILAGLGALAIRSPDATLYADAVARTIEEGRFSAISRNRTVVAYWNEDDDAFELAVSSSDTCTPDGGVIASTRRSDFPRATVDASAFGGIAWRPNGLPTFCGSTPSDVELVVADTRSTSRTIVIDTIGKVTVQ